MTVPRTTRRRPIIARLLFIAALSIVISLGSARHAGIALAQARTPAESLAQARAHERAGEWEAAETAFTAALVDAGEIGENARLELGRMQEQAGRYRAAADTLRPLTVPAPTNDRLIRGWFQYASVLQSLGDVAESIRAYQRYVELNGPAAAYARVETAKMQAGNGDHAAALTTLSPVFDPNAPAHARRVALREGMRYAEILDQDDKLLEWARAMVALSPSAAEQAAALLQIGTLERERGAHDAAAEAYRRLVTDYPGTSEAEDAVRALGELGQPATLMQVARVNYVRGNNSTARGQYNEILGSGASPADRAVALFYLGALAERRDDAFAAVENYTESYNTDPTGALADDALWWRGQVLEELDRYDEAQASYARILEQHGDSSFAPDASFRYGYQSYLAGRKSEALTRWTAGINQPRKEGAARAAFWAGKVADEQGDSATARVNYSEAVRRNADGYYGLRAAAVLAGQANAPGSSPLNLQAAQADWDVAERWLAGWAFAEDGDAWNTLRSSEDWRSAWELSYAGWTRISHDAFSAIMWRHSEQSWLLYRIGRALAEGEQHALGMAAARTLIARAPAGTPPAGVAVTRLAYPLPWLEITQRLANRFNLDPLLVYAMMRQESAFNPTAGSSAGAFGLTQVITGTAGEIATALGKSGFQFNDLARPALAIEFGSYYLSTMIKNQNGNVYRGLAAYNGGGGSVARWVRTAGSDDIDRFYETIDFAETKSYVRLVIENYAWYRYLYGVAERPSVLPR